MRYLLITVLFFCSFPFLSQTLYREKILFKHKSRDLTAANLKQIREIWERLPFNAAVELVLISDREVKKLSPGKQASLTRARAESVRSFLTTQKIVNINDIELNTHAFIEPEMIHNTDASFNRKVRDPYKVYSLVLSKEVPLCFDYTIAERRALNSKDPAVFTISTTQDETIQGPEGVIVMIPAHSFILPEGFKGSEVRIRLWEFLSLGDMLAANLYTTSSGTMLETGGMIYITADCEGTCLKLLRSSKIIVKFPTGEKVDSMRLFRGMPMPEIINWKNTNNLDQGGPAVDSETGYRDSSENISPAYYVLESSGLGWINCDRFYDFGEKVDVAFTCPQQFTGIAGLIFSNIKSILPGDFVPLKEKNVIFYNVPRGMKAILLIYSVSGDNKKISYTTREVILGETQTEALKFSEAGVKEFKILLRELRRQN